MGIDLALVWAGIIAFAVLMYVVLDGFDLGIGILFPFIKGPRDRDRMISSVAPVWDGNETWLVLGGGGLYAVFPLAYSVLLTAFYAPLIAMLLALIFRGVAFEFRFRDEAHKPYWDVAFIVGSVVATFCQGIVLGSFVQGIAVEGRSYAGGWFDWFTPFSVFTGIALMCGYALLGATWLIMKMEGELQDRCYQLAKRLGIAVVLMIVGVSVWTPWLEPVIFERWFSWPNVAWLSPVPILVGVVALGLHHALATRREVRPFLFSLALFVLAYLGLGISLFPMIVPPTISLWAAAAPPKSLSFLLVGALVLLPLILGYTAHAYWVFRGKTRDGDGYH